MTTLKSFLGDWRVNNWQPKEITFKYLLDNCDLAIVGDQKLTLTWMDGKSQQHEIHFDLQNDSNQITSGEVNIEGYMCVVTLTTLPPDPRNGIQLEGGITVHDDDRPGDGPVGTFTAEAGSGSEDLDAPRLAERLAV